MRPHLVAQGRRRTCGVAVQLRLGVFRERGRCCFLIGRLPYAQRIDMVQENVSASDAKQGRTARSESWETALALPMLVIEDDVVAVAKDAEAQGVQGVRAAERGEHGVSRPLGSQPESVIRGCVPVPCRRILLSGESQLFVHWMWRRFLEERVLRTFLRGNLGRLKLPSLPPPQGCSRSTHVDQNGYSGLSGGQIHD